MTGLCNCIIVMEEEGMADRLEEIGVQSIYKKQECGNYRTIALILHASKVLLQKTRESQGTPERLVHVLESA